VFLLFYGADPKRKRHIPLPGRGLLAEQGVTGITAFYRPYQ